eukprot:TRINITY_DN20289_c0_g1_i2.p1 TRINITY_DN20289_c0_g1~~TRINITY_DN20289_c0_g1_i2.p1  ORF type:complete len:338 (+),score=33.62 TRINITY_DN20289_c0_g1_i2:35-1048(+)
MSSSSMQPVVEPRFHEHLHGMIASKFGASLVKEIFQYILSVDLGEGQETVDACVSTETTTALTKAFRVARCACRSWAQGLASVGSFQPATWHRTLYKCPGNAVELYARGQVLRAWKHCLQNEALSQMQINRTGLHRSVDNLFKLPWAFIITNVHIIQGRSQIVQEEDLVKAGDLLQKLIHGPLAKRMLTRLGQFSQDELILAHDGTRERRPRGFHFFPMWSEREDIVALGESQVRRSIHERTVIMDTMKLDWGTQKIDRGIGYLVKFQRGTSLHLGRDMWNLNRFDAARCQLGLSIDKQEFQKVASMIRVWLSTDFGFSFRGYFPNLYAKLQRDAVG